jgi:hypothetical protein
MNTNIAGDSSGDVWWLVLVNNMGTWVGHILGAPDGSNTAGSDMTFTIAPDGSIVALNSGNGAGSTNTINNDTINNSTTTQTNNAALTNNLTITANTGGNNADRNTGGNSSITTGNANVAANIVNFINNNFVGHKFMIAIVNIFGTLVGDIVPPNVPLPVHNQEVASALQNGGTGGPSVNNSLALPTGNTNSSNKSANKTGVVGITGNGNNSSGNNSSQVLGISALKLTSPGEIVSQIPLSQAVKSGFTVNYGLITLAVLVLLSATLLRNILKRRTT